MPRPVGVLTAYDLRRRAQRLKREIGELEKKYQGKLPSRVLSRLATMQSTLDQILELAKQ